MNFGSHEKSGFDVQLFMRVLFIPTVTIRAINQRDSERLEPVAGFVRCLGEYNLTLRRVNTYCRYHGSESVNERSDSWYLVTINSLYQRAIVVWRGQGAGFARGTET